MGHRKVPFSRVLYIERDDFMEDPPMMFWRLAPGREVRLRWAYYLTCQEVVKDPKSGEVKELRCTYDPATKGGYSPDGRKVKGTIHWVSAEQSLQAKVRLYDLLFSKPRPGAGGDYKDDLNPKSLETLSESRVEPSLAQALPGSHFQFERIGYFVVDTKDSKPGQPVFNRTVTLRDTWAKIMKKSQKKTK
jgi:glutaminyl-tRNA synthetase